jgi:hypothetical protein
MKCLWTTWGAPPIVEEVNSEAGKENSKINKEEVPTTPLINKEEVPLLCLQLKQAVKKTQVLGHKVKVPATEEVLREEEEIFPVQKVLPAITVSN